MRLGATLTQLSTGPARPLADWARELVDAGFDSLWTPHIIGRGTLIPDPFVALATAAAATDGIELGTATLQVPLFHPAELAYRILSLQAVCGDRLTLGLSPGSTDTDYATLDHDYSNRFDTFYRNLTRLRGLLDTGRDAEAVLTDQPSGRPKLLLGSWGKNVDRAAREFDGWLASGYRRTPDQIIEALARFRMAGGGRAMVCAIQVSSEADLAPVGEQLRRYREAGFDDAVVVIEPGGPTPADVRALLPPT